jgi:hypothetical protein
MVLLATIKLCFTNQVKFKNVELVFFILTLLVLGVIFVYHYYALIDKIVVAYASSGSSRSQDINKAISSVAIELGTTLGIIVFFFC